MTVMTYPACLIVRLKYMTRHDSNDDTSYLSNGGGVVRGVQGVHIADVSHFVQDGTALDQEAQRRSTTVYLVNQAITMLPSLLSAELCSLNPHTPRLCYSCIFRMTADGLIIEDEEGERAPWYGRSIIQTCCRLHYGLVQDVIEGTITKDNWPEEFLPTDGHTVPQVCLVIPWCPAFSCTCVALSHSV